MAKARVIVKRRRAVRNIRKITATMQLIATARFQKCMQRAVASRPYTQKIGELIETLAGQQTIEHPLLKPNAAPGRSILLVISSNRGLCGAYNASVLRRMIERRKELSGAGIATAMEVVGKKGINYLHFLGLEVAQRITDVEDRIAFARVAEMAERYMRLYEQNEVARVDVVYMQFHSVGVQRPQALQLLPIEPPRASGELLSRLIPEAVKIRLFQCFNDAIVSEQVSRMVAMKAATDAAGDMIKLLTRQYNRARQSQITTELADIVGGANAVQ
jgi:F-type H+-transporting ATPase subunit gamma